MQWIIGLPTIIQTKDVLLETVAVLVHAAHLDYVSGFYVLPSVLGFFVLNHSFIGIRGRQLVVQRYRCA